MLSVNLPMPYAVYAAQTVNPSGVGVISEETASENPVYGEEVYALIEDFLRQEAPSLIENADKAKIREIIDDIITQYNIANMTGSQQNQPFNDASDVYSALTTGYTNFSSTIYEEPTSVASNFVPIDVSHIIATPYVDDGMDVLSDDQIYGNQLFDSENAEQMSAKHVENQLIVKFKDVKDLPRGYEKQLQREIDKVKKIGLISELGLYVINVDDLEENPNTVLNRLKNNRFIEYVEPNYLVSLTTCEKDTCVPNDTNYNNQKSMLTTIKAQAGWYKWTGCTNEKGERIESTESCKNSPVVVAVVDSGVAQLKELPLLAGYATVSGMSPNNDMWVHGTFIAGISGATGNNKNGITGINWNAKILPVKIDNAEGSIATADLAKGITLAADNGAKVINLSVGMTSNVAVIKTAVNYAYDKGCALIAATGNESMTSISYPARYDNVLGVGATTADGKTRESYSNYGTGLDVMALGTYYSATPTGYGTGKGTSFSTPQVAGLASLLFSMNPKLTPAEVYDYIRRGASLYPKYDTQMGYGTINIANTLDLALKDMPAPTPAPPTVPENPYKNPPTLTLKGFLEITITVGDGYQEAGYTAVDCLGVDITKDVVISGSVDITRAGIYEIKYTVTDKGGNTAKATRTVIINAPPPPPVLIPPSISIIGSNTIILHDRSGTPYYEQGARAFDSDGNDISASVVPSGYFDRNTVNDYTITYTVTDKNGSVATAERTVRIIPPDSVQTTRTPYGLSGMSKQGARITHANLFAASGGWMDLKVASIDKNMTISANFVDRSTQKVVFTDTFTAAGSKQYNIDGGSYDLAISIDKANGSAKYTLQLLMPETKTSVFGITEVPMTCPDVIVEEPGIVEKIFRSIGKLFVRNRKENRQPEKLGIQCVDPDPDTKNTPAPVAAK